VKLLGYFFAVLRAINSICPRLPSGVSSLFRDWLTAVGAIFRQRKQSTPISFCADDMLTFVRVTDVPLAAVVAHVGDDKITGAFASKAGGLLCLF